MGLSALKDKDETCRGLADSRAQSGQIIEGLSAFDYCIREYSFLPVEFCSEVIALSLIRI
jgi:hypothetical protein